MRRKDLKFKGSERRGGNGTWEWRWMLELFSGRETIPACVRMTNDNLNIEQLAELCHRVAWQPGRTCPIKSQQATVTTARYFMWTNRGSGAPW